MEVIQFLIQHQFIERIDKFFVVAKSKNYLRAMFHFESDEWNGLAKTAIFSTKDKSYTVILEDDSCIVPWEVLAEEGSFEVSVFGGDLITVSTAKVNVHKSGYKEGETPEPPTPSVYSALLEMSEEANRNASDAKSIAESVRKDADEGKLKCVLG